MILHLVQNLSFCLICIGKWNSDQLSLYPFILAVIPQHPVVGFSIAPSSAQLDAEKAEKEAAEEAKKVEATRITQVDISSMRRYFKTEGISEEKVLRMSEGLLLCSDWSKR